MLRFDPNALCYKMIKYVQDNILESVDGKLRYKKKSERLVICNEGSSRSSKTFDAFHFLFWMCGLEYFQKNPLLIYVVRKTLKSCREKTYDGDFVKCMKIIGHYDTKYERNASQSPEYNLFGSTLKFIGLDDGEELGMCDVFFFNEALDNHDEQIVNQMLMRCEKLAIFDWNPKFTYHFLFDREGMPNYLFTKTTFWDNKHISNSVKSGILSYCPWDFKDFDYETRTWKVPEELRSPNKENEKTMNRREWLVYGEGVRCPEDDIIFPNVTWIESFPDSCDEIIFGLDFGYTSDPSVLVKVGRSGFDLFVQYLTYEPCENTDNLFAIVDPILLDYQTKRKETYGNLEDEAMFIHCDSSDKYKDQEFVEALNISKWKLGRNYNFIKTHKIGIVLGISLVKKFNLHVVDCKETRKEFENYCNKRIDGTRTNIPIDAFNHGIDAMRYVVVDNWLYLVQ